MVGAGREHSEPPSSTRARRGAIIRPRHLRRVLVDSMQTPAGASSSAGRGRGKTKRGAARGGRGGGRGRKPAAPSSLSRPAISPDHRSAPSQVEPSDLDPSRTPVHEPRAHEPRVAEPSSQETRAPESSSHETPVPESSSQVTPETSGHADGEETWSDDSFSDGERVEQGKNLYQHGGTKLPRSEVVDSA